jgi:threonine dehydratase
MIPLLPTLDEMRDAAREIYQFLQPTPTYRWPQLCERVGAEVWTKHENHLPVGAFKVRGGIIYMRKLQDEGITRVTAATRGNHGQSVAWAARQYGMQATIVVPAGRSVAREAMRCMGATVLDHGANFEEAFAFAHQLAESTGARFVPSFDMELVRGVGSYALELFEAAPNLDRVYVPIGLGSGICGVVAVRNGLGLNTEIVGVVAENAPCYYESLAAGEVRNASVLPTIADGLGVGAPHPDAFALIQHYVPRIIRVSEHQIQHAISCYFEDTHNLAEGAGAAALAAALIEREQNAGKKIAVILSGSNVAPDVFLAALEMSAC